jgi:MEDS: MEthanogen/methylotroph, DcmR Sensory domain
MVPQLELGIHDLTVGVGDHLCGLYSGTRQRDELVIPFLEAGLRRGDKCICVVDGVEPTEIVDALGPDVDGAQRAASKQLDVMGSADVYLRSGSFSPAEIVSSWKAAIAEVMYDGRFDIVRAVETWSLHDVVPPLRELLALESEMNRYLPLYPQVIVCLYDLERFGGGVVVDLLKTHPRILMGGMVLDNPYWLMPEELLGIQGGDADALSEAREEVAEWCYAATTGST